MLAVFRPVLIVFGVLVLAGVAFVAYARLTSKSIDGISCDFAEQTRYHVHAHLTILVHGHTHVQVPAQIGIDTAHLCLYWLHTHDATGIIHIEAPRRITPTLGQFFAVWGQPLSSRRVAGHNGAVHAFVDGRPYRKNPATVRLRNYTDVVLEVGAPVVHPPKANFAGY